MPFVSRLFTNNFFRGSLIFTVSSFIISVLNYLFSLLVARNLGPVGFGEIAALNSYTAIFSVPMTVISMVIIQKMGSHKDNTMSYAKALEVWFLKRVTRWGIFTLPLLLAAPLVQKATNLTFYSSVAILPFVFASFLGAYYGAILQGLHLFGWISIVGITAVSFKIVGAFLAIPNASIPVVLFAMLIANVVTFIIPYALMKKMKNSKTKSPVINKRMTSAVLDRQVITTALSILGITLLGYLDLVIAKKYLTPNQAGIYSSWSLFAKIILYFMGPLITASYIFFSSKKNARSHERVLYISLGLLVIVACVSFLFYQYLSLPVIQLLFGNKFSPIAPVLGLASIFGSLYTATTFLNNYFLSRRSTFSLITTAGSALFFISLLIWGRSTISIIWLSIISCGVVLTIQLLGLMKYNSAQWNTKRLPTS